MSERAIFIIAPDVLQKMFEGHKQGKELLEKMNYIKQSGGELYALTTLASFQRSIYLMNGNIPVSAIQKTLNFLTIAPSFANFMDEKAVVDEILIYAKTATKMGNVKSEKYTCNECGFVCHDARSIRDHILHNHKI